MTKISLMVKEDVYRKYQEICREKGESVATEVRRYMLDVVEKDEAKKAKAKK